MGQDKQRHLEEIESELNDLKESKAALEEELKGSSETVSTNTDKIKQLEQAKTELQKALIDAQQSVTSLQKITDEKQAVENELKAQQEKAANAENELEKQKQKVSASDKALQEAQQNQSALQEQLTKLESQVNEAKTAASEVSADASATQAYPVRSDIEALPSPENPVAFFDLNYFWSSQDENATLSSSLQSLLVKVEDVIAKGEKAVESEKLGELVSTSQALMKLARSINAEPLVDLAQSLENDCRQGLLDNALIRWYPTKTGLQKTLKVVYQQLHRL